MRDIASLKEKLKKAETAKITAEAQAETLESQLKDIEADMQKENVTPDTIDGVISTLEGTIESETKRLQELIPDV